MPELKGISLVSKIVGLSLDTDCVCLSELVCVCLSAVSVLYGVLLLRRALHSASPEEKLHHKDAIDNLIKHTC